MSGELLSGEFLSGEFLSGEFFVRAPRCMVAWTKKGTLLKGAQASEVPAGIESSWGMLTELELRSENCLSKRHTNPPTYYLVGIEGVEDVRRGMNEQLLPSPTPAVQSDIPVLPGEQDSGVRTHPTQKRG